MDVLANNEKEKNILMMMSGGRDSFLSVCHLVSRGYTVHLVTYDNGHMSGADNVLQLVERLKRRFGSEKIKFVGIFPIAQNLRKFLNKAFYSEPLELCKEYPHLLIYQVNCLVCHTVMYFHSIAYCKANGISEIAEGARKHQKFFVELPEMKGRYEELCKKYSINLHMPVYELESDIERKEALAEWEFLPKTYEPQCWLGCPMYEQLGFEQIESLVKYYDLEILPIAEECIEQLIVTKKFPKTDKSNNISYV